MMDSPELYAPRTDALTPHEAATQRAAKASAPAVEAAARVIAEALASYVFATLDPSTAGARVVAAVFAGSAATAAREILRAWGGWCASATAVRIAAASTPMGGAQGDARAVLTSARDACALLIEAHASCDREGAEGDPAALARLDARDRAVAAWVALATGRGPYELAEHLPATIMHPRAATALAAPVLSALVAWERDARLMLDAAVTDSAKPLRAPLPLPVQGTPWPSPPLAVVPAPVAAVADEAPPVASAAPHLPCPHHPAVETIARLDAEAAATAAAVSAMARKVEEARARGDAGADDMAAALHALHMRAEATLDRLGAEAEAAEADLRAAAKGDA